MLGDGYWDQGAAWACGSPGPGDRVVSSTDMWLLLSAACLDGSARLCTGQTGWVCGFFPSPEVKATWGGFTHFIAVQVCGKPGEFH